MANPAAKPPSARPDAQAGAAPLPGSGRKLNPLVVIIPLVVMVLVAAGLGWELFRDRMEAQQRGSGDDSGLGLDGASGLRRDRKSREVKVAGEPAPAPAPSDDDDLAGLGKKKKPALVKPSGPVAPAERAWRAVKSDYDKLEARNETTARKYRMRILTLEDRKTSTAEPSFVKEAGVLEEELRGELAKPENQ